jgi:hypothetical protein
MAKGRGFYPYTEKEGEPKPEEGSGGNDKKQNLYIITQNEAPGISPLNNIGCFFRHLEICPEEVYLFSLVSQSAGKPICLGKLPPYFA